MVPQPAPEWQPVCKICERGTLVRKKVFRMSGPVVFIGFVFLIPSVLGIIASILLFFGVLSTGTSGSTRTKNEVALNMRKAGVPESIIADVLAGNADRSDSQIANQDRTILDAQEKVKSNLAIQVAAGERMLQAGIPNSIIRALSTEGRLSTPGIAGSSEMSEWLDGATPEQREMFQAAKVQFHEPPAESLHAVREMQQAQIPVDVIYDVRMSKDADVQAWMGARHEALQDAQNKLRDNKETSGFALFFGGGFAVAMGIASFVGGLLGWLLVMRKSVLQCSVCSAVVNAS